MKSISIGALTDFVVFFFTRQRVAFRGLYGAVGDIHHVVHVYTTSNVAQYNEKVIGRTRSDALAIWLHTHRGNIIQPLKLVPGRNGIWVSVLLVYLYTRNSYKSGMGAHGGGSTQRCQAGVRKGNDRPQTPKPAISPDPAICWRVKTLIPCFVQHGAVSFLAGWVAATLGYLTVFFLHLFLHFFSGAHASTDLKTTRTTCAF